MAAVVAVGHASLLCHQSQQAAKNILPNEQEHFCAQLKRVVSKVLIKICNSMQESSEDTQYQPDEPAAITTDASSGKLQAAFASQVTAMSCSKSQGAAFCTACSSLVSLPKVSHSQRECWKVAQLWLQPIYVCSTTTGTELLHALSCLQFTTN